MQKKINFTSSSFSIWIKVTTGILSLGLGESHPPAQSSDYRNIQTDINMQTSGRKAWEFRMEN